MFYRLLSIERIFQLNNIESSNFLYDGEQNTRGVNRVTPLRWNFNGIFGGIFYSFLEPAKLLIFAKEGVLI